MKYENIELLYVIESTKEIPLRGEKTMKKISNSQKYETRNPRNNKRMYNNKRHLLINQHVKNVYERRVDHNFNENKRAFC